MREIRTAAAAMRSRVGVSKRWWREASIVEHREAQLLRLLQIAGHDHGAAPQPTLKGARRETAEKFCARGTSAFHRFLGGACPVSGRNIPSRGDPSCP